MLSPLLLSSNMKSWILKWTVSPTVNTEQASSSLGPLSKVPSLWKENILTSLMTRNPLDSSMAPFKNKSQPN